MKNNMRKSPMHLPQVKKILLESQNLYIVTFFDKSTCKGDSYYLIFK